MRKKKIRLDTVDKVKEFVNTAVKFPGEIELHSGRHIVDGKSIMGIFSLDTASPVTVVWDEEISDGFDKQTEKFEDNI